MTGDPYFFRLVQWWQELPHPNHTLPTRQCSLVAGAHLEQMEGVLHQHWLRRVRERTFSPSH